MAKLEPGYTVPSLENGITRARENIATFKDAIAKERATIREYETLIKMLVDKRAREEAAVAEVQSRIEVVRG